MRDFKDEMRKMHRRLNSWMKDFNEDPWDFEEEDFSQYRKAWVDAREMENEYILAVELPGVNKEDIDVNVEENTLTIKVEKKSEEKSEKENAYSYQSSYSGFFRRIPLPENADTEKVEAEYKSGVLKLRIQKKSKVKKGKSIKIK